MQLVMNFGALQLQDPLPLVRDSGGLHGSRMDVGDVLGDVAAERRRNYYAGLAGAGAGMRGLDLALPSWGPGMPGLLDGPGGTLGRYQGPGGALAGDVLGYRERYGQNGYRPLGDVAGAWLDDGYRRPGLGMATMVACRQCGVRQAMIACSGTCRECVFENGLRARERERERDRDRLLDRVGGRGLLLGYGPRRAIGY